MVRPAALALLVLAALAVGGVLAADLDGDGLPTAEEVGGDTAPLVADTDADGLDDAEEVAAGTDPTARDTDGDGLADGREATLGTDPTATDTDGDGLADGREVDGPTDPAAADTDGDGLDDRREADGPSDPTVRDTDADGLDDAEEVAAGADPTAAHSDDDGLDDAREVALGTDPAAADTDGDGLVDPVELRATESELPGADPLYADVYVELDRMRGCSYREAVRRTVEAFRDAPVENPDGRRGIALHVVYDDRVPRSPAVSMDTRDGPRNDFADYRSKHFDNRLQGYHYALVVEEVPGGLTGVAKNTNVLVECNYPSTFMHELGHALGLTDDVFRGIDSEAVRFRAYPSVMNYDAPSGFFEYSDGSNSAKDHDDWGHLATYMSHRVPSYYGLREKYVNETDDGDGGVWNTSSVGGPGAGGPGASGVAGLELPRGSSSAGGLGGDPARPGELARRGEPAVATRPTRSARTPLRPSG